MMTTQTKTSLKQLRAELAAIAVKSTRPVGTKLTLSSLGDEYGHAAFTLKADGLCKLVRVALTAWCAAYGLAIQSMEIRGGRYNWHYFYVLVPREHVKNPDKHAFV